MERLNEEEIARLRDIRISTILNLPDLGRRISMPCPMHDGRNPNFSVYPNNSYHCFKCLSNGQNAVDFMRDLKGFPRKMNNTQFIEVVESLLIYI